MNEQDQSAAQIVPQETGSEQPNGTAAIPIKRRHVSRKALEQTIKDFDTFLELQGKLYNTRKLYCQSLQKYMLNYVGSVDDANDFLLKNRAIRHRASIKLFFYFIGRPDVIPFLSKHSTPPAKHVHSLPPKDKILEVISSVKPEKYRLVARIQYDSGRRAHEVLQVQKENITIDDNGDMLFYVIGKKEKPYYFYVSKDTEKEVSLFLQNTQKQYPFLEDYTIDYMRELQTNPRMFPQWLKMNTRKYFLAIKDAREFIGVDKFASHDLRRNFITELYNMAVKKYQEGSLKKEPLWFVRDVVGHARTATTEVYIKQSATNIKEAVRELRG